MISVILCKVSQPSLQKRKSYEGKFVTVKCSNISDGATLKGESLPVKFPNQTSSPSCISGTACLIICEISLFVTAANREAILLVTYASLASLAFQTWQFTSLSLRKQQRNGLNGTAKSLNCFLT